MSNMKEKDVKDWIKNGPDPRLLVQAESLGKMLNEKKLSTSQIRQIFTKLKAIEAKGYISQRSEFMMLKPYIAYAAKRHDKDGLYEFKKRVSWAIDVVLEAKDEKSQKECFRNFCKFFEAILAYHRASGGK